MFIYSAAETLTSLAAAHSKLKSEHFVLKKSLLVRICRNIELKEYSGWRWFTRQTEQSLLIVKLCRQNWIGLTQFSGAMMWAAGLPELISDTLSCSHQWVQHCEPSHFNGQLLPIVLLVHMLMFSSVIDFAYRHSLEFTSQTYLHLGSFSNHHSRCADLSVRRAWLTYLDQSLSFINLQNVGIH